MSGADGRPNNGHSMARAAEGLASLKHRSLDASERAQARMPLTYELTAPDTGFRGYGFDSFGSSSSSSSSSRAFERKAFPAMLEEGANDEPIDLFTPVDKMRAPAMELHRNSLQGEPSRRPPGAFLGTSMPLPLLSAGDVDAQASSGLNVGKKAVEPNMWNLHAMNAMSAMNAQQMSAVTMSSLRSMNGMANLPPMNAAKPNLPGLNGFSRMSGMTSLPTMGGLNPMNAPPPQPPMAGLQQVNDVGVQMRMAEVLKHTATDVKGAMNRFRSTLRRVMQSSVAPLGMNQERLADACTRSALLVKELDSLSSTLQELAAPAQAMAENPFMAPSAAGRRDMGQPNNLLQKLMENDGTDLGGSSPLSRLSDGDASDDRVKVQADRRRVSLSIADFLVFCVGRERFPATKPYQAVAQWKQHLDNALSDESPKDPATLAELASMQRYFTDRYRPMIFKAPPKNRRSVIDKCYHHLREMLRRSELYHVAGCQDPHWLESSGRGFIAMALWDPLVVELFGNQSAGDTLLWHLRQECLGGGAFAPGHMKALACSLDRRIVLIPTDEEQFTSGTPHVRVFSPFANRDRIEPIRSFDCLRETQRINDIHISSQDAFFVGVNQGAEYCMSVCVQRSVSYFLREKHMHYLQRYTQLGQYRDWAIVSGIFGASGDEGGQPMLLSKQWTNNAFDGLQFGPAAVLKMALSKVRSNPESVVFLLHGFGINAEHSADGPSTIGTRQYEDLADFALRYVKRWQAAVDQLPGWLDFEAAFRSRITDFANSSSYDEPLQKKQNEEDLRAMLDDFVHSFVEEAPAARGKAGRGAAKSAAATQKRKRSNEVTPNRRKKAREEPPSTALPDAKVEDHQVQMDRMELAKKWFVVCSTSNLPRKAYSERMQAVDELLRDLNLVPHQVGLSMVLVRTALQVHLDVDGGQGLDQSICDRLVRSKEKLLFLKDRGDDEEQRKRQEIYDAICLTTDDEQNAAGASADSAQQREGKHAEEGSNDMGSMSAASTSTSATTDVEDSQKPSEKGENDTKKTTRGNKTDSENGNIDEAQEDHEGENTSGAVKRTDESKATDTTRPELGALESHDKASDTLSDKAKHRKARKTRGSASPAASPEEGDEGRKQEDDNEADKNEADEDIARPSNYTLEEILDQVLKDAIQMLSTG